MPTQGLKTHWLAESYELSKIFNTRGEAAHVRASEQLGRIPSMSETEHDRFGSTIQTFDAGGVSPHITVTGFDQMGATECKHALSLLKGKRIEILVMHQMLKQLFAYEDAWDLDADWFEGLDIGLVVLGDLHMPMEHEAHGIRFYYTGSSHMRSINEPREKSYLVIDDDFSVRRIPLITRDVLELVVATESQRDDAMQQILDYQVSEKPTELMRPLIYVRFTTDVAEVSMRLRTATQQINGHYMENPTTISTAQHMADLAADEGEDISLLSCVPDLVDVHSEDREEQLVCKHLVGLLESDNPRVYIEEMKGEFGL